MRELSHKMVNDLFSLDNQSIKQFEFANFNYRGGNKCNSYLCPIVEK